MIKTTIIRTIAVALSLGLMSLLLPGCRNTPDRDDARFTVEEINGVRFVHNHAPQNEDIAPVKLDLIGRIGKLESEDEKEILFDPIDAARLPNGDILILEGRGCTVKRFNQNHEYISSFGEKGQGPGDLNDPSLIRVKANKIYVRSRRVSVFSHDGRYEDGFTNPFQPGFGSFGAQYRTSGMAVLSESRVVLPSRFSLWLDSGKQKLFTEFDKKGAVIRSFGAFKRYENPELTVNANIAYFAADSRDNLWVAYAHQNKVSKYSQEGDMILSTDRILPYAVVNTMKSVVMKSGPQEAEFPWPSVTAVTKGIYSDSKDRIWVLTYLKQPNKFLTFDAKEDLSTCYEFDVFAFDGVHLFKVPFPNVRFENVSICDDRLYLIDAQHESCVHEYRIVERN